MRTLIRYSLLIFAALLSSSLQAQDITGDYILDIRQDPGAADCIWDGDLNIVQTGGNPGSFSGTADVTLVSGACIGFSGVLTGTINGSALTIGVGLSGLGTATFSGSVVNADRIAGTWAGLGLTGTWAADRVPVVAPPTPTPNDNAPDPTAVPALPIGGLILLSLLIAGIGARFGGKLKGKR